MNGFRDELAKADPFDTPSLDKLLHDFATAKGVKPADVVHPVRVAVTGVEVGFGLFDTLAILGREMVLQRIDKGLQLVQ